MSLSVLDSVLCFFFLGLDVSLRCYQHCASVLVGIRIDIDLDHRSQLVMVLVVVCTGLVRDSVSLGIFRIMDYKGLASVSVSAGMVLTWF